MLLNINVLFWDEDVEIREDGVIDENVVEAFSCGHCHAFALALHRALGWELVGLLWENWEPDEDEWTEEALSAAETYRFRANGDCVLVPGHVAVRDEDGVLYDVTGPHDPDEFGGDARPIPEDFVEAACDGMYRPTEAEFASTFVEAWKEAYL